MAEQDISPDADLQLKKRARRRLVGAVALALFAVIVLPMVMDREPRPLNQDLQVRIPSQDASGPATKVLPGRPEATALPAPKSVAEPKPEMKATTGTADSTTIAPVATSDKAASASTDQPVAKAIADGASDSDSSAQWVVQLGAYRETGNVKTLLSKLKGLGVTAYTEKYDTPQGPRMRVRAGPFASKAAADKARARIKIIGVDGQVAQK